MTDKDQSTGMPEVPDGYFWRVKMNYLDSSFDRYGKIYVALRRKRKIGSVITDSAVTPMWELDHRDVAAKRDWYERRHDLVLIDPVHYENLVYGLAEKVLEYQAERFAQEALYARRDAESKKLKGDYPPKKLGG